MMRRCLNEALAAARGRHAFGKAIAEYPLLRRQLMKIMLPTEQALSMFAFSADPKHEKRARLAAGALYHAATAALLAWEGATLGAQGGDARRLLLSRLVIEHRLAPQDPLSLNDSSWEQEAMDLLLDDAPVPLEKATALLS
jgi:hypothetical protein